MEVNHIYTQWSLIMFWQTIAYRFGLGGMCNLTCCFLITHVSRIKSIMSKTLMLFIVVYLKHSVHVHEVICTKCQASSRIRTSSRKALEIASLERMSGRIDRWFMTGTVDNISTSACMILVTSQLESLQKTLFQFPLLWPVLQNNLIDVAKGNGSDNGL